MNFEMKRLLPGCGSIVRLVAMLLLLCAVGCGPALLASPEELAAFEKAGPVRPVADVETLTKARLRMGAYRVVVDDVLELHMPVVTRDLIAERNTRSEPILCRVGKTGAIRLPVVGEIGVVGKTLAEIEAAAVAAYYPKYVKRIPSVTARVSEYRTARVSVIGAVGDPGIYELRSDEMSLVAALTKAGSIVDEGAGAIRIRRADEAGDSQPLLLPVKGLNIPFADVALKGGEVIEVERLDQQNFTVVGLVNKPGVFPYPPGVQYNLAQALASAGGLDIVGNPQYVKICRQDASGRLLVVPFKIGGGALTDTARIVLKPGDVVAVEKTSSTETRRILLQLLRVGFGMNVSYRL